MHFRKYNTYGGWLVFILSTIVYFLTIEDTVSLWDCGEYITAAYKLEVGHPPGAPLFMVIGRLFSFFAAEENVAVWINRLSALSSSGTILFMFWTISLFGKKLVLLRKDALSSADLWAILLSSFVGSMAYTFSESFWFSAVEGEVYAMSSLFTAVIFWAALKWDEEMIRQKNHQLDPLIQPNRWLLLIMFLLGLAIGVHLLGILVVPAIGFLIYFNHRKEVSIKGMLTVFLISVIVLGFIQEAVIPGSIAMASFFEVKFRNSMGLPFFSGTIFFFTVLIAGSIYFIRRFRKNGNELGYNIVMGLIFLLIGYGSFAVIVIRSNANTPLDENDPENLVTLHAYLKREQYGSSPLLFGPYWNSKTNPQQEWKDRSPFYLRRFVVTKGEVDTKAFVSEKDANAYASELGSGAEVVEKYFESNAEGRKMQEPTYAQTTFFPRMYYNSGSSSDRAKIAGYKSWSGYDPTEDKGTEKGENNERLPTFGENMQYFFRYQVNFMYWRYFLWNFAGRQNDIQGHGSEMRGNWLSGYSFIDEARLGAQGDDAPYYTSQNPSNNKFFLLPLILGLVGLFFHYYRAPKDAFVITLAFLFTGLAIVVYLNQKPLEPRERDYAYAGSFYFFAMWIGLGVLALYDAFCSFAKEEWKKIGAVGAVGLLFFLILDQSANTSFPNTLSWIVMVVVGGGALALMVLLRKVLQKEMQGAVVAGLLGLFVPIVMGMQGWDDHDRSEKSTAHDLAYNYLNSCGKNGILYTNGDNDTFPLWYMQEVEGVRTDVRVCNLSLMQTDWYTNQMKMKAYESDPLPIQFREDQILMYAGNTDQVLFVSLLDLYFSGASEDLKNEVLNMRLRSNQVKAENALLNYQNQIQSILAQFNLGKNGEPGRLELLKRAASGSIGSNTTERIKSIYTGAVEMLQGIQQGVVEVPNQEQIQAFQKALTDMESAWDYTDLKQAMAFVRNDKNMLPSQGNRMLRFFPSSGFVLKVNKENAKKSGVLMAGEENKALSEIIFNFDARGLTREQVMMLDVMANNDWKRGIYYSSPGASEVAMALYRRGWLKQSGLVYELTPLQAGRGAPVHLDKMYQKLMKEYKYGKMNEEGVLTDYYARRHTQQYRQAFETLANGYLDQAEEARAIKSRGTTMIDAYRQTNQMAEANRMQDIYDNADKIIKESEQKAIDAIAFSLKIMPVDLVFDHGEPGPINTRYRYAGTELQAYGDGSLHNYVSILYRAGAKKKANALAEKVSKQLESIIDYFVKTDPRIAVKDVNLEDLYAALDAYFIITQSAIDVNNGDRNSAIAKHMQQQLNQWFNVDFPALKKRTEQMLQDNGESIRLSSSSSGAARAYFQMEAYLDAMAEYYGIKKSNDSPNVAPNPLDALQR